MLKERHEDMEFVAQVLSVAILPVEYLLNWIICSLLTQCNEFFNCFNSFSAKVAFWRLCVVLLTGLFHLEITNPGKKEFLKSVYRNKSYLALKLD